MDEPFSGLDPVNAVLVEQTLLELKDQGKAILFSTHRMDQVEKLCDSICLINNGEAVLAGKVREIKSRYERNHVIVEFEGSAAFLKSAGDCGGQKLLRPRRDPAQAARQRAKTAARSCRRWRPSTASSWSSLRSKRSSSRLWEARPMRNMLLIARREYLSRCAAAPSGYRPSGCRRCSR